MSSQRIVDEFRVYEVQWTKHKTQKRKVWVEGTLVHHLWNGRVVLKDSNGYEIERPFIGKRTIEVDKEIELDKHLVLVEDLKETGHSDITEVVQAKSQKEEQASKRARINSSPSSTLPGSSSPLLARSSLAQLNKPRVNNRPNTTTAPITAPTATRQLKKTVPLNALLTSSGTLKKLSRTATTTNTGSTGRILNQSTIIPRSPRTPKNGTSTSSTSTATNRSSEFSSPALSVRKARPLLSLQRKKDPPQPTSSPVHSTLTPVISQPTPTPIISQSAMTNRRGLLSRQRKKPRPSQPAAAASKQLSIPEEDTLVALLDDQILSQRPQLIPPTTDRFSDAENSCPPPSTQFVPSASQLHLNEQHRDSNTPTSPQTQLPATGPWSAEAFELFRDYELPEDIKTKFSNLTISSS
ncbi:hypothetical protein TRVA0_028S01508 [Trichomonascus vanleenenianus]|uniref:DNA helicase ZGRF1-like domain-containing protein n=1 Tax=Trichomonascus vanleenenianus TaxID=2268995 RepID=UPI003EC95A88